jgi:putative hydrolase of the HAD superfamily
MLSVQTRDHSSRSSRDIRRETARNTAQPARGNLERVADNLPRAVFLDLDDTIIDDSSSVDGGWRTAVVEHAQSIDAQSLVDAVFEVRDWYWSDAERHRVGRQDLRTASTWIAGEALRRLGHQDTELARRIANRYRDIREHGQQLLPGAIEAIERLREHGIRLALLTNGSSVVQRAKIERFRLARHFDYICIEGEFGCGKPDDRVYRSALQATTSQPNTAWMVGDNLEWDVIAPMRLGLTGIWLDRFARGLPDATPVKPDRIIFSLTELV